MTLALAIWGAVLSTVTFVWNVVKWLQEKPRIFAAIQAVESLWSEGHYGGIRLKLRNRGGKKTTVEAIFFYQRQPWFEDGLAGFLHRLAGRVKWRHNLGVSNPKTAKLPVVLDINEVWEGFIQLEPNDPDDEEERRQLDINRPLAAGLKSGVLRYSIQCAHTNQRIRGVVGTEDDSLKE